MFDKSLCTKAVNALFKYEFKKREENTKGYLISEFAKPFLIQIDLSKPVDKPLMTAVTVNIPHSFFSAEGEDHRICFFCRNNDKDEIITELRNNPLPGMAPESVLSLGDVKKYYVQLADKKKLLREYTHFLCDAAIVSHLYNLLGKVFSVKKKFPLPIKCVNLSKIRSAIQKEVDSTHMYLHGKKITIRFGHTAMPPTSVVENIMAGMMHVLERLGGMKNVRSVDLRTSESPSLPLFKTVSSELLTYIKGFSGAKKTGKVSSADVGHTKTGKSKKEAGKEEETNASVDSARVTNTRKIKAGMKVSETVGREEEEAAEEAEGGQGMYPGRPHTVTVESEHHEDGTRSSLSAVKKKKRAALTDSTVQKSKKIKHTKTK